MALDTEPNGSRHRRWWWMLGLGASVLGALSLLPSAVRGFAASASQAPRQEAPGDLIKEHDNTNFPLVGLHRTVDCGDCHINGIIQGTPTACEACHWERRRDDFYALQLGVHCDDCHTPQAWKSVPASAWDHESMTGFRLEGQHRALDCSQCHEGGRFGAAIAQCSSCHRQDFERAAEPDHVAASFPLECELCHTSSSRWEGAVFEHTTFPLIGQHRAASCNDCHGDGRFAGISTDCASCHLDDFERTTNPNHRQAGFTTDCASCHGSSASSWRGATFDHDRLFPLTGRHRTVECSVCHQNGQFTGTPTECVACHRADYEQTTNPNHSRAGFPTDCASCHGSSASSWTSAPDFDHDRVFPLKGRHRTAECSLCHRNGQFTGTPTECIGCHQPDYDRTTNPNHRQAGFSTDCTTCHGSSATSWSGASIDHDRFFVLNGMHRTAACAACHPNGRFAGTPTDCVACHQADYNQTTNPNHRQAGFSTDCTSCHGSSATSWNNATFNHDPFFVLQGPHRTLECQQCHSNGFNLPTDCFGCHAADYTAARSPDHAAAQFPTTCENCHFPNHLSWTQAVFQHDFPIDSGKHNGLPCSDCHFTSNFRQFECINCHIHEKTEMDSQHIGVVGYMYQSQACYGCHPDGQKP